jgi:hypothetical protein
MIFTARRTMLIAMTATNTAISIHGARAASNEARAADALDLNSLKKQR